MLKVLLIVICICFPLSVVSEVIPSDGKPRFRLDSSKHNLALAFASQRPTNIEIETKVVGGCWTDISSTKTKTELFLLDRGWQIVSNREDAVASIDITVFAVPLYKVVPNLTENYCTSLINVKYVKGIIVPLFITEYNFETSIAGTLINSLALRVYEKSEANDKIFKAVQDAIESFLVDIKKSENHFEKAIEEALD